MRGNEARRLVASKRGNIYPKNWQCSVFLGAWSEDEREEISYR